MNIDRPLDEILKEEKKAALAKRKELQKEKAAAKAKLDAETPKPAGKKGAHKAQGQAQAKGEGETKKGAKGAPAPANGAANGGGAEAGGKGKNAKKRERDGAPDPVKSGAAPVKKQTGDLRSKISTPSKFALVRVWNIEDSVSKKDVTELAAGEGAVKMVKMWSTPRSQQTAEIAFELLTAAQAFITKYNGVPLDGRPLRMSLTSPEKPGSEPPKKKVDTPAKQVQDEGKSNAAEDGNPRKRAKRGARNNKNSKEAVKADAQDSEKKSD
ncbi:THO complex subunit 4 [Porphyridium purpureum]|uniref:THO complex subunit 4 n=1 Tax=Porphyridium purpureum TaxID=35688 RepID=A0A5J4YND2_PORPP|nr:THO complex subunit 4 [Porphyridium purpureum]|eukprot:POR1953..scf222_8